MRGKPFFLLLSAVVCGCGQSSESSILAQNNPSPEEAQVAQPIVDEGSEPQTGVEAAWGTAIDFVDASLTGAAVVKKWLPLPDRMSMFALEGTVEESVEMARDDDLLTAWSCSPSPDSVCNFVLTFPQPATVTGIRLFGGSGVSRKERQRFARPRQIKISTEVGWITAELKDTWDYQHILLPATVTRAVRVEIVSLYPGKKNNPVIIPEFEVFGSDGVQRAPLVLDGIQVIGFGWRLWEGSKDARETTAPVWMDLIDGKGGVRRLLRGSGWIAAQAGRFAIVPNLHGASCPGAYYTTNSSYTLVDMEARMFYSAPLNSGGEKSVIAGDDGRSFAHEVYDMAKDGWIFAGFKVAPDGRISKKRETFPNQAQAAEKVQAWLDQPKKPGKNFPDAAVVSGGGKVHFREVTKKERRLLFDRFNTPGRGGEQWMYYQTAKDVPWQVVEMGDVDLFVFTEMCSESASLVFTMKEDGKLVDRLDSKQYFSEVSTFITNDGLLLIGAERQGGAAGDIFVVTGDGKFTLLYSNHLFDYGPAPGCRCSA